MHLQAFLLVLLGCLSRPTSSQVLTSLRQSPSEIWPAYFDSAARQARDREIKESGNEARLDEVRRRALSGERDDIESEDSETHYCFDDATESSVSSSPERDARRLYEEVCRYSRQPRLRPQVEIQPQEQIHFVDRQELRKQQREDLLDGQPFRPPLDRSSRVMNEKQRQLRSHPLVTQAERPLPSQSKPENRNAQLIQGMQVLSGNQIQKDMQDKLLRTDTTILEHNLDYYDSFIRTKKVVPVPLETFSPTLRFNNEQIYLNIPDKNSLVFESTRVREDFHSRLYYTHVPPLDRPLFPGQVVRLGFCMLMSGQNLTSQQQKEKIKIGLGKDSDGARKDKDTIQIVMRFMHDEPLWVKKVQADKKDGSLEEADEKLVALQKKANQDSTVLPSDEDPLVIKPSISDPEQNQPPEEIDFGMIATVSDENKKYEVYTASIPHYDDSSDTAPKYLLLHSFEFKEGTDRVELNGAVTSAEAAAAIALTTLTAPRTGNRWVVAKHFRKVMFEPMKPNMFVVEEKPKRRSREKSNRWRCFDSNLEVPVGLPTGVYEFLVTFYDSVNDESARYAARAPKPYRVYATGSPEELYVSKNGLQDMTTIELSEKLKAQQSIRSKQRASPPENTAAFRAKARAKRLERERYYKMQKQMMTYLQKGVLPWHSWFEIAKDGMFKHPKIDIITLSNLPDNKIVLENGWRPSEIINIHMYIENRLEWRDYQLNVEFKYMKNENEANVEIFRYETVLNELRNTDSNSLFCVSVFVECRSVTKHQEFIFHMSWLPVIPPDLFSTDAFLEMSVQISKHASAHSSISPRDYRERFLVPIEIRPVSEWYPQYPVLNFETFYDSRILSLPKSAASEIFILRLSPQLAFIKNKLPLLGPHRPTEPYGCCGVQFTVHFGHLVGAQETLTDLIALNLQFRYHPTRDEFISAIHMPTLAELLTLQVKWPSMKPKSAGSYNLVDIFSDVPENIQKKYTILMKELRVKLNDVGQVISEHDYFDECSTSGWPSSSTSHGQREKPRSKLITKPTAASTSSILSQDRANNKFYFALRSSSQERNHVDNLVMTEILEFN